MRLPLSTLLFLAACAAPPRRSQYVLAQRQDLVLSNSPVMVDRPAPVVRAGHPEVPYSVLVLNRGPASVTLTAQEIEAHVDQRPLAAQCQSRNDPWPARPLPLEISAGMQVRIDCVLRFPDAAPASAAVEETVRLTLWKGSDRETTFEYLLWAAP